MNESFNEIWEAHVQVGFLFDDDDDDHDHHDVYYRFLEMLNIVNV